MLFIGGRQGKRHGDTAGTSEVTVGDPEAPLRYTTSRCWHASVGVWAELPATHRTRVHTTRRGCHSRDGKRQISIPKRLFALSSHPRSVLVDWLIYRSFYSLAMARERRWVLTRSGWSYFLSHTRGSVAFVISLKPAVTIPSFCTQLVSIPRTGGAARAGTKIEVDALGVITISPRCFERCGSNKKTPP